MLGLNLFIAALSFSVALAAPAPVPADGDGDVVPAIIAAEQQQEAIAPVVPLRWSTHFADHFPAGTHLDLEWEGGDGMGCELYYVPHWPGFAEYQFVTIVSNTTENSYKWAVPNLDAYPEGTDFILGVKNGEGVGANWYDLTPSLPLR
ncbi:uncharacterized protein EHS24_001129 [Apiotrichum porosum]|uniref:Uncharacterized protein n=1 Tax=Apiotrichum porosum TaxID=105984 RepID=A0A427YBS9_9TREE|nr:uncharacterized protein EHS24_001129 [Apiotrichum porosum]RSH88580.1 hypothetical protein EHS24_001129 [Apiotrichum porosum]